MTEANKHKIAASFPEKYAVGHLDLEISVAEYAMFEAGVFARDMEEKWHLFVLDSTLYFARSWTNYCIYKVFVHRQNTRVMLSDFHVSRDADQYKSEDLDQDTSLLKLVLQIYLKREDF